MTATRTSTVAYTGFAVLVVLAVLGKSAVMLVSVLGMGFMFWLTRATTLSKRLLATASGALLASWGAEAVHTAYHMFESQPSGVGGDNGFFFVSATLVGLINACAFVAFLVLVESLTKRTAHV